MSAEPFASAPFVVGESASAAAPPHIPAQKLPAQELPAEESLCPVVSHDRVNDEYKHLVVEASPKALTVTPGQFFNLLCPSPDVGELFFRRPQSVYRIDRERGRIEFLYK
jgi:dihydroorotate dehydrogenase electron transfer subunit